jgi:hypothetical protein
MQAITDDMHALKAKMAALLEKVKAISENIKAELAPAMLSQNAEPMERCEAIITQFNPSMKAAIVELNANMLAFKEKYPLAAKADSDHFLTNIKVTLLKEQRELKQLVTPSAAEIKRNAMFERLLPAAVAYYTSLASGKSPTSLYRSALEGIKAKEEQLKGSAPSRSQRGPSNPQ